MKPPTKAIYNKLLYSGIILLAILLMQPIQIFVFFKDIDILFPKGIIALKELNLLLLIQVLMLIIVIPVYILTFIFSWWYRADNEKATYDPHLVDHKIAEIIWWGLPFVMTILVAVITWIKTHELDPYKPIKSDKKPIQIEVVALQWKWLFIYPEEKIAMVNYIQFPKDVPVHFRITADAPMNSFWIPRLGGQIYAMPGMETQLYLMANEEGKFQGSSANISGEGFSGMTFITEASTEKTYQEWIQSVRQSPNNLDFTAYKKLAAPTQNHPVEYYRLAEDNLFHEIMMLYMKPPNEESKHG